MPVIPPASIDAVVTFCCEEFVADNVLALTGEGADIDSYLQAPLAGLYVFHAMLPYASAEFSVLGDPGDPAVHANFFFDVATTDLDGIILRRWAHVQASAWRGTAVLAGLLMFQEPGRVKAFASNLEAVDLYILEASQLQIHYVAPPVDVAVCDTGED